MLMNRHLDITRMTSVANRKLLQRELRIWLERYTFTHFVTLSSNHQSFSYQWMKQQLREWDARVNHSLNGRRWQKRPDERLVWFAFPEKLTTNPHWHLLVAVDDYAETAARAARLADFHIYGRRHWMDLCYQGSFDAQRIESKGIIEYVTKVSADTAYLEKFVLSREVMNI